MNVRNDSIILEDTEINDLVNVIGLENPIDQIDVLVNSGTKFTTELKIELKLTLLMILLVQLQELYRILNQIRDYKQLEI